MFFEYFMTAILRHHEGHPICKSVAILEDFF